MKRTSVIFLGIAFLIPYHQGSLAVTNDGSLYKGVNIKFEPSSVRLQIHHNSSFNLQVSGFLLETEFTNWTYGRSESLEPLPTLTLEPQDGTTNYCFNLSATDTAGKVVIGLESENNSVNMINNSNVASLTVLVVHSISLAIFSDVIGWIYFVAWSISFYPQVIVNFRRKSVTGLSFDFLALNITGFVCYTIFNVGLFWIPQIQKEYFAQHPRGAIPVEPNDVFFAIHAVLLTLIQIIQCFIYERGGQKLFKATIVGLGLVSLATVILLVLSATAVLSWLTYLYYFSYVKLGITLIKYIPQAWMNFRLKSTVGWSIGNVLLDFTGGVLSLGQLFINAYNLADWESTVGNPTKIGLGLFSIFFDVIFISQHYCLYNRRKSFDLREGSPFSSEATLPVDE